MRYRQTEIGAVDAEIVVAVVDIADVLQHGDDRELGVLHRRTEDAKVPEVDVRAHSIRDVGIFPCRNIFFRSILAGGEDAGDMRPMVGIGFRFRVDFDKLFDEVPVD